MIAHYRRPFSSALTILLVLLLAAAAVAAPKSRPEITPEEIRAHVRYLASEELAGRGTGTPGNDRAAAYLADQFRRAGVEPAGEAGSYFQRFEVVTGVRLGKENRLVARLHGAGTVEARAKREFMPVGFSASGEVTAPLVFSGYGISQPQLKHDDYAGIDVKGKIALVLRRTPDGDDHGKFAAYAALRYKATVARERGAEGVIFLTGPQTSKEEDLGQLELDGSASDVGIPVVIAKRSFVETIVTSRGRSLDVLQRDITHQGPQSFVVSNVEVTLLTSVERLRAKTANVIGRVQGADPRLKDEIVVLGAHYDHLGMGGEGSLHNSKEPAIHHGADDNASGTAGILELAQYFAGNRSQLKRSLLFMGFSGEELGLLGSAHYVRNPVVPLEKTVAMINLDMVGRSKDESVQIIGAGTSSDWKGLLESVNGKIGLKVRTSDSGFGASDQQSFYARDIPVLFFFTGVHADYHRPTDTWEKINAEGEARILHFVAEVAARIAAMPERPRFVRANDPQPTGARFSVYVGSIPDYSASEQGVTLSGVREGSPAEKAGLRAGDVIIRFGERKIANVYDYTYALQDAKPDVALEVQFLRAGQRMKVTLTPAARR